jgi:hypothetical protein
MYFNNLNSEKKKELLQLSRPLHEQVLYGSLIRLGIDPSSFDPDNFDVNNFSFPPNVQDIIDDLVNSLSSIKIIEKELSEIDNEI